MSIFKKKVCQYVTFLCTFDDIINFRGARGTKNWTIYVVFQSEYYVKKFEWAYRK